MADSEIEFNTKINTDDVVQQLQKVGKVFHDLESSASKSSKKQSTALKSVSKNFEEFGKKAEKAAKAFDEKPLVQALKTVGSTLSSLKTVFSGVTGVIGAVTGEIMAMADAANTQSDAETKLALAAKNNPYLDDYSVQKLKEYAGELQSVSEVGDEALLPMMAKLAAAGRNQSEIMDIMKVSLDVAAGSGQSLDSVVNNLSKTFGGYAGELGETVPEIKALSAEQLKNGEAVKILGEKYKGMAEATANPIVQLSNTFGDLKEKIGGMFLPLIQGIARGLTTVIDTANVAFVSFAKDIDSLFGGSLGKALDKVKTVSAAVINALKGVQNALNDLEKDREIREMTDDYFFSQSSIARIQLADDKIKQLQSDLKNTDRITSQLSEAQKEMAKVENRIADAQRQNDIKALKAAEKKKKSVQDAINMLTIRKAKQEEARANGELSDIDKENEAAKKAIELEIQKWEARKKSAEITADWEKEQQADKEKQAQLQAEAQARKALLEQYEAAMNAKNREIKIRKEAGEEIDAETEAQEKYNTAFQTYVNLLKQNAESDSPSDTSALDSVAKADIADLSKTLSASMDKKQVAQFQKEMHGILETMRGSTVADYKKLLEQIDKAYQNTVKSISDPKRVEQLTESMQKTMDAVKKAQERAAELEAFNNLISADFWHIDQTSADSWLGTIGVYYTDAKNELKKALDDNLITEEEYNQKIVELEQKTQDKINEIHNSNVSDSTKQIVAAGGSPFGTALDDFDKKQAQCQAELDMLNDMHDKELLSEEDFAEKKAEIDEQMRQNHLDVFVAMGTVLQDYANQSNQILQDACGAMLDMVKNEATEEQAEIELKYKKGELSEEEYNEKIKESKKKAAKEEFKIKMVQWAADLLLAQSNVALGIASSLKVGGIAGILSATLTGAAGAVQLATAIANKPTPPSFATGGIVPGRSYSGDNVRANVNSGEMIMNQSQQKGLWNFINAGSPRNDNGTNITVNNSASNMVSAQPRITKEGIELIITQRVNAGLQNGDFDKALSMQRQNEGGTFYGI